MKAVRALLLLPLYVFDGALAGVRMWWETIRE